MFQTRFKLRQIAPLAMLFVFASSSKSAFAQQSAGDKEFGFGGSVFASHGKPFTGSAFFQASFGKFTSKTNYFGVSVSPNVTFGSFTSYSTFVNANYRRLKETSPKLFPFVGVGGGGLFMRSQSGSLTGAGKNSSTSVDPNVFAEAGFKSYISQRTSFEVAYNFIVNPTSSGGFGQKTQSLVIFSLRHLF